MLGLAAQVVAPSPSSAFSRPLSLPHAPPLAVKVEPEEGPSAGGLPAAHMQGLLDTLAPPRAEAAGAAPSGWARASSLRSGPRQGLASGPGGVAAEPSVAMGASLLQSLCLVPPPAAAASEAQRSSRSPSSAAGAPSGSSSDQPHCQQAAPSQAFGPAAEAAVDSDFAGGPSASQAGGSAKASKRSRPDYGGEGEGAEPVGGALGTGASGLASGGAGLRASGLCSGGVGTAAASALSSGGAGSALALLATPSLSLVGLAASPPGSHSRTSFDASGNRLPPGITRPLPQHPGTRPSGASGLPSPAVAPGVAVLSELAGQLGRLTSLVSEVEGLKAENSALRASMQALSHAYSARPAGSAREGEPAAAALPGAEADALDGGAEGPAPMLMDSPTRGGHEAAEADTMGSGEPAAAEADAAAARPGGVLPLSEALEAQGKRLWEQKLRNDDLEREVRPRGQRARRGAGPGRGGAAPFSLACCACARSCLRSASWRRSRPPRRRACGAGWRRRSAPARQRRTPTAAWRRAWRSWRLS
jgi:hypothetical protein